MTPNDIVEIYRRRGKWRWRYKDGGNHKAMANGGEAYSNFGDICASIAQVLGLVPFEMLGVSYQRVSRQGGWPDVLVVVTR